MRIVKAKEEQIPALAAIEADCFPKEEAATGEMMRQRWKTFPDCFWVAEDENGKAVGFVDGCRTDQPNLPDEYYADTKYHQKNGDWQTVFGLNVLPEYRHRKIATHLMMALISDTDQRGMKGVVLTCKDHMKDFYDSLGFRWQGVSDSRHGGAKWNDMLLVFDEKDRPQRDGGNDVGI